MKTLLAYKTQIAIFAVFNAAAAYHVYSVFLASGQAMSQQEMMTLGVTYVTFLVALYAHGVKTVMAAIAAAEAAEQLGAEKK